MRYTLYAGDEDEPRNNPINRIGGLPVGVRTEDWPRAAGRPMQHLFSIDLAGLALDVPAAAKARVLAVFVDSYYEIDPDSSDGVAVLWLEQAQVDAVPRSTPPADFVAERRPGTSYLREEFQWYPANGIELLVEAIEVDEGDDESEGEFGESYLGGAPAWAEAGPPAQRPAGAFVLLAMSYEFPLGRRNAGLLVFEAGAYLQAEYEVDDDAAPPWPQAIAASQELVVLDQAPAADALQKWGGLPRGVSEFDWPTGASHILTWIPEPRPEGMNEDAVAYALFGRLAKTNNWDDELSFYEVVEISESDLERWDADELEVPAGVEILPERAVEFRPLTDVASWHDLQTRCFMGPRPAWRAPERQSARSIGSNNMVLQLTDALLPVTPGRGTLHVLGGGSYPVWQPEPGAPQATAARYLPQGTLYADDTTAAIVVGWQLSFTDFSVLPERVEQLEKILIAALATRGHSLRLYVPSDTTTDRNREIRSSVVLGRAVVVTEANDPEPGRVDPKRVADARAQLPALDDDFWREALTFAPGVEAPVGPPGAYLLSWGPLCYGAIYVGVEAEADGECVYEFVANQDMSQERSGTGVDGVHVESVEFSSITEIDLDPGKLAAADKLDQAGFWLICRYD